MARERGHYSIVARESRRTLAAQPVRRHESDSSGLTPVHVNEDGYEGESRERRRVLSTWASSRGIRKRTPLATFGVFLAGAAHGKFQTADFRQVLA